jgi:hypothetical protein
MGCDRATLNYQLERYVPTDNFSASGNINLDIMPRLIFWFGSGRLDCETVYKDECCVEERGMLNPRISDA